MTTEAMGRERLILEPSERRDAFVEAIGQARERVRLSMFRCTDFKVLDSLGAALERGVKVELLLTQRAKGWEKKIRELGLYLESMGAKVSRYGAPRVKYHAKYLVADGRVALVASLNLMKRYFEKTSDYLLISEDPGLARSLDCLFEHDVAFPSTGVPPELSPRLLIGPEESRANFRTLLTTARKSLRIADHKVTDPEMVELLRTLEKRGVEVEVLGKGSLPGLKSHGKALLVDGALLALGSISLSTPSLDLRRELSVTVEDPDCVAKAGAFLERATVRTRIADLRIDAGTADAEDEDEEEDEE